MDTGFDKQEAFNKAYRGLKAQGFRRSLTVGSPPENTGCSYRGEGGMKCALGHLIPDELYKPEMEGMYAYALFERKFLPWQLTEEEQSFLGDLQRCHDRAETSLEMKSRLSGFAADRGLTIPAD